MVFFLIFLWRYIVKPCEVELVQQKKKTIPLFRYCPLTRKYHIVFWRCLPFPICWTLKSEYWTHIRHPQKSNHHKSVFFFFLIFTKPYCQTERSRGRLAKKKKTTPLFTSPDWTPLKPHFIRTFGVNIFTKKRIKKKPKVCSGYSITFRAITKERRRKLTF